ncbi:MAG: preprotein translocase subunit SecY [Planctomycetes bacterium]|nr:preprotein translocase subunit SecY [Planctomycetota bacterium]
MSNPLLSLVRVPDLRKKLLITIGLLAIYRIGFHLPLPGVNLEELQRIQTDLFSGSPLGALFGMMNMLTGAGIGQAVVFSLGVMPYISASIIFSLLVKVVPSLEALQKEGPAGTRKINQYTRLLTVPICVLQAFFVCQGVLRNPQFGLFDDASNPYTLGFYVLHILVLTAGTIFVMWLGEQLTEHGIGNGISLIIMSGIIADMPSAIASHLANSYGDDRITNLLYLGAVWVVIVIVIVYITRGQRRIPIQQAKLTKGRSTMGGQKHYLPLRINQAGVMPIIFASALFLVPQMLGQIPGLSFLRDTFGSTAGFWYITTFSALIFFFSFFWNSLMFQPTEIANNLKEHGSFVPGIRPGKKTAEYLERVMTRITVAGAAFLAAIAILPNIVTDSMNVSFQVAAFLGGTSVLIVVGVALDLVDKVNAYLVMRSYEGIVGKGNKRGPEEGGAGWAGRRRKA